MKTKLEYVRKDIVCWIVSLIFLTGAAATEQICIVDDEVSCPAKMLSSTCTACHLPISCNSDCPLSYKDITTSGRGSMGWDNLPKFLCVYHCKATCDIHADPLTYTLTRFDEYAQFKANTAPCPPRPPGG